MGDLFDYTMHRSEQGAEAMTHCHPECNHDQGRHCACSHMATRRCFWLEPAQEEETSKWPEWFVIGCFAVAFLGAAFLPG